MVQYVLKRVEIAGRIAFEPPADLGASEIIKRELRKCRDKHNDFVLVTLQPPKRPRTTGEDSQNHHLNGHIMQICNETGNDYESVKNAVKMIAVENMGYPYNTIGGHIIPQRERDCSTDECAKLIEAAHLLAADLGITLQE
ncbi:hypothetical protein [Treponema denticola]|uniref:hypothetical protein n=1 Tax=Treponema denticola TaxID=158 RepID=UPI0002B550CD|nr:hypothetical protein [Treponema denticola]EMB44008.1 hypothetical protein HMPREF9730_01948 [Treponema denticola AL-2]UTC93187.1 hypothetical protein E4N84_08795 [Treponema denticola]